MAVNPNTDFTAGAVLTAAQQNRFPRGVMGEADSTSFYSLTGTLADVPGMSFTFTAATGRLYKFMFQCASTENAAVGTYRTQIQIDLNGTNIQSAFFGPLPYGYPFHVLALWSAGTPSAGSITAKVRAYRDQGVSGGLLYADASTPMRFWCEDVGPY